MRGRHRTGWKAAAAAAGTVALLAAGPVARADGGGVPANAQATARSAAPATGTAGTGTGTATSTSTATGTDTDTGTGTGTVDAVATLDPSDTTVAPGRSFYFLKASVDLASGNLGEPPAWTMAVPVGVTYVKPEPNDVQSQFCKLAAGGRSLHCSGVGPDTFSTWYPKFRVDEGTRLGTSLPFTLTADIGDAVDSDPANNTASVTVTVGTGTDWGLKWQAPGRPVQPGTVVHTVLVVTNHGPGASTNDVHISFVDGSYPDGTSIVHSPPYGACAGDSGVIDCYLDSPVPAGTSVSFPFDWKFPASARGKEMRLPTGFFTAGAADGNPANDQDTLVVRVAKAAPPSGTPTTPPAGNPATPPPGSGTSSGTSTGTGTGNAPDPQGGTLAATGSSPAPLLFGAAAALAAGAAALALGRRRTAAVSPGRRASGGW